MEQKPTFERNIADFPQSNVFYFQITKIFIVHSTGNRTFTYLLNYQILTV